jgi:hypothetical protein
MPGSIADRFDARSAACTRTRAALRSVCSAAQRSAAHLDVPRRLVQPARAPQQRREPCKRDVVTAHIDDTHEDASLRTRTRGLDPAQETCTRTRLGFCCKNCSKW